MNAIRLVAAGFVVAVLGGTVAQEARAVDELAPAQRGSASAHARLFHPFSLGPSRFRVNPFGRFVRRPRAVMAPPATSEPTSAAAFSAVGEEPALSSSGDDEETFLAEGAVRPPFRPPVRSPFRPPPRPPFAP